MATSPIFGWEEPDDTDLVKDGAAAIRTLGNAIDTTMGTMVPKTIVDAKGDLIAGTASDTVSRLAVGSNDQVLIADSTTATGLKWGTPSGGGLTLISETVASGLSSLSLSSIPQTYKTLYLVYDGIYNSATNAAFDIRLNNDSSNNYHMTVGMFANAGTGSNTIEARGTGLTGANRPLFGDGTAVAATDYTYHAKGWIRLDNYSSTTKVKRYNGNWSYYRSAAALPYQGTLNGTYNSTSAISSIDIYRLTASGTFSNGTNTSILLYGES